PESVPSAPAAAPPAAGESITNVQHAGVDEGGIVKTHGDHLVILRRGRIFTVRFGGGALQPVAAVDAFGPGIDPQSAWYDELLVSDTLVAVIGYSYRRGGTEVGLFRIDAAGGLAHRGTYQLKSYDYYSASNYASRLVDGKLVFYAPIRVSQSEDPYASFPAVRRWGGPDSTFRRTAAPTRVYRPAGPLRLEQGLMLHTVTVCDPAGAEMRCRSTALYGPRGREFYVSPRAVYVWAISQPAWDRREEAPASSILYRMPLDGSAPSGVRVTGAPEDQFSFLESSDGHLNVLVHDAALRGTNAAPEPLSLLRVPLAAFGDGSRAAPAAAYRPLLVPERRGSFENRYVGSWLLYGTGNGVGGPRSAGGAAVFAVRWGAADSVVVLPLPHGVDRIEAMGTGAVVVGSASGDLHFSGVRLGTAAALADRYTRRGASQGETRSHGFFYRPDAEESGLLGLPIRGLGASGYEQLRHGSASVLFLRNRAFRFTELGDLSARPANDDDGCRASCVDWYGNARPLFLRGRIFALMGYELVEGAEDDGRIREVRRVSYVPRPPQMIGVWDYDETVGREGDRYRCRSRGTYRFTPGGATFGVTYQQTGQCTFDGRTIDNSGQGSGTGTVRGNTVTLELSGCRPTATLAGPDQMEGTFSCPARLPDGGEVMANGRWTARRR
ncbi:MAG TPA: beta-propeller domain-containing protein, partial [Longimicrobium sp.]|nr:beta-propeller domain-containing protein [Longimicrobium sp.]